MADSKVFSFRLHPDIDPEAYDILLDLMKQGHDVRSIMVGLLLAHGGIEFSVSGNGGLDMRAIESIINNQTAHLETFLTDAIQHMVSSVIEDVRFGKIDPNADDPFEEVGGQDQYTAGQIAGYRKRYGKK